MPAELPALNRVLALVRKLIDYGRHLADAVQAHAGTSTFNHLARPFGTADLAVILARITAGLRRAAAVEAWLCRRAEAGRELVPPPFRAPTGRTPPAARPATQPAPKPAADPRLDRLPTEAELAAELRTRPVGAVIADVCRALGIAPGSLDRAFWDEITNAIVAYGGSLAGFIFDLTRRMEAFSMAVLARAMDPPLPAAPEAPATGPP